MCSSWPTSLLPLSVGLMVTVLHLASGMGAAKVSAEAGKPTVYFVTAEGGLKSYSVESSETSTVVNTSEALIGVTYDFNRDLVYWSSFIPDNRTASRVYRKERNGNQATTVLRTDEYGIISAMDFDWLTGNIYLATSEGHILACNAQTNSSLNCASILSGHGSVYGIAVDPNQGFMYWTRPSSVEFFSGDGSISRAGMDGSGVTVLVPNLNEPKGIAIDFQSSRLYWTVPLDGKVKSSDMQGKDIRTVMKFPSDSYTNGIGLFGNQIYVTNRLSRTLETFTTAGQDLQVLHTDTETNLLFNLAIVSPRPDLPRNRTNHCENHGCTKVCVLTRTSSRCVD